MKIEKKDFREVKDKKRMKFLTIFSIVVPFLSLPGLLLLWLYASSVNADLIPPLSAIWNRLLMLFVKPVGGLNLFGNVWVSLRRVLIALSVSCTLGILFGTMIGWNKTAKAIFGTLFELLRSIPPLAWIPIVIMWFSIGEFSKILIIFTGTFTPIVINTYTGIKMVRPLYLDIGRIFNANNRQLLTEIAIPAALPNIFAGLRCATSAGWMIVLAAEMMGAKNGMGYLIIRGLEYFDVPLILVGMLVIGIVGAILAIITDYVQRWVCPWNKKIESE